MSEPGDESQAANVHAHLHTIAQLLRQVQHLSPEAQELLAEFVDELGEAVETNEVPPAELNRLAEEVAALLRASAPGTEHHGILAQVRDRLEQAATAVESRAPMLTGLTRRLIETLSELGI